MFTCKSIHLTTHCSPNQSCSSSLFSRIRTPTPEPPAEAEHKPEVNKPDTEVKSETEDDDEKKDGGDDGDEPVEKKLKIYKLPPCVPLQVDENGQEIRVRIPKPLPLQKSEDLDLTKVTLSLF